MARPKEFDVDATLERAMDLFWARGYQGTSMNDLVAHLGISRQSLYDTFGDKHAIYKAALQRFRERYGCPFLEIASDEPIRGALRRVFQRAVDMVLADASGRGCMMVNAAIELGTLDEEVREVVRDNAKVVEDVLVKRLRKAQELGEIGAHHDPVALARFFASVMSGLRVASKMTRDRQVLEDIVRVALGVLG